MPFEFKIAGEPQAFVPGVIPFTRADDDSHVVEFPGISHVRQILIRAVEINVLVVIAVKEIADVERPAQADEMADGIGKTKGDVGGVISAETRARDRDAMTAALAPREVENVVDDHTLESVMGPHAIGRVDSLVIKAIEIGRIRAINRDFSGIDKGSARPDQTEIFVLGVPAERGGNRPAADPDHRQKQASRTPGSCAESTSGYSVRSCGDGE